MIYVTSALRWLIGLPLAALALLSITLMAMVLPIKIYNRPGRALLRGLVWLFGGRVCVEGLEQVDPARGYLFMSNHVSLFDIPVLGGYIPNLARGLQAAEQFNWPIVGWFLRAIGNIPISRENARASWASMQKAAQIIKNGTSVILLPEGTRTRTGKLSEFKKMPFHFAKMAEVPIVPIGLSGLYQFKNRGSWLVRPGLIKVRFGRPIPVEQIADCKVDELRLLVRERISEMIETP